MWTIQVGGQVVEYYKQAIKSIEHSNSKEHGDRIIDFIGNKQQNQWAALIKFKVGIKNISGIDAMRKDWIIHVR